MTLRLNREQDDADDLIRSSTADPLSYHPVTSPQTSGCTECQTPLNSVFYTHDGNKYCQKCYQSLDSKDHVGSTFHRVFRASLFGAIASLLGSSIYFLIAWKTGYEFGLISILIGFMVGVSVKIGSHGMGGWFYQSLAVLLTYFAVALSYFGITFVALLGEDGFDESILQELAGPEIVDNAYITSGNEDQTSSEITSDPTVSESEELGLIESVAVWVLAALALVVWILSLPVLVGIENLLSLVILLLGLFEAWRQNRIA